MARYLLLTALLAACALYLSHQPAAAQEPSHRGVRFLHAVDQGDIDAALELMVDEPELVDPEGSVLSGRDAVRAYLETFPRPIEIVRTMPFPSGSRMFQALITADGMPLQVTFTGQNGRILAITFEPAPDMAAE